MVLDSSPHDPGDDWVRPLVLSTRPALAYFRHWPRRSTLAIAGDYPVSCQSRRVARQASRPFEVALPDPHSVYAQSPRRPAKSLHRPVG